MDVRHAVSLSLIAFVIAGCSESSGLTYSELPEEPTDSDLVSAELRWAKILSKASEDDENTNPEQGSSEASGSVEPDQAVRTPAVGDTNTANRAPLLDRNPVPPDEPLEPRKIKLLIPDKSFRAESGNLRVGYDDIDLLKILNMEPVPIDADEHFPKWLSALNGKQIRIRGWMIPPFQSTGLKRFQLARDNGICCFVRQPKIYDVIDVAMADGQTTDFIAGRPFDVEGTFEIMPEADDDELFGLYRLRNAIVTP